MYTKDRSLTPDLQNLPSLEVAIVISVLCILLEIFLAKKEHRYVTVLCHLIWANDPFEN